MEIAFISSMIRVQTKISVGLEVLQFFTTRNWHFKSTHFEQIYKDISAEDRQMYAKCMVYLN